MSLRNESALKKYLSYAKEISKEYELRISLEKIITSLSDYLPSEHYHELINDSGHGFQHGLDTVKYALLISDTKDRREEIALAAFFHDICGINYDSFSRAKHHLRGSHLVKNILFKIINKEDRRLVDLDAITLAIKYHWQDVSYFLGTLKKALPAKKYSTCAIVRDADTIDEALNIKRIIKITETYKRALFNRDITPLERIAILLCEEEDIIGSKRNDLMMYLLRNVTKSLDIDHYLILRAKKFMNKDIYKKNIQSILGGIDEYKYRGDFRNKKEISSLLKEISKFYFELKDSNKLETAKNITRKYSQKGGTYFEKHRPRLVVELNKSVFNHS
jgi:HD superfamily phosphodiesterase